MMDDVTVYMGTADAVNQFKYEGAAGACNLLVHFEADDSARRAILCGCFAGEKVAMTARRIDGKVASFNASWPAFPNYAPRNELLMWPADQKSQKAQDNEQKNARVIDEVFDRVAHENTRYGWRGIIVIAGETGSRKSTYLRAFARRYVDKLLKLPFKSRPHVVTYEDPIETWFATDPDEASDAGFEYTPRQSGPDVPDLRRATTDALRQRPALFIVGEVRRRQDWLPLMDFASTGHFAITTTHAGSLTETFQRIVFAAEANTPAKRSELATRLVAVVHLRAFDDQHVLPSMWVRTARSRSGFIQDGLAGVLPNKADGCYGRAYFAQRAGFTDLEAIALVEDLRGQ